MLQGDHSAILSTFIKLPFVINDLCFVYFLSGRFTQVLPYKNMLKHFSFVDYVMNILRTKLDHDAATNDIVDHVDYRDKKLYSCSRDPDH